MGREEIRRLCLNVWASPAVSPGGGPGAGFGEFSKGRVPPRAWVWVWERFWRILQKHFVNIPRA